MRRHPLFILVYYLLFIIKFEHDIMKKKKHSFHLRTLCWFNIYLTALFNKKICFNENWVYYIKNPFEWYLSHFSAFCKCTEKGTLGRQIYDDSPISTFIYNTYFLAWIIILLLKNALLTNKQFQLINILKGNISIKKDRRILRFVC